VSFHPRANIHSSIASIQRVDTEYVSKSGIRYEFGELWPDGILEKNPKIQNSNCLQIEFFLSLTAVLCFIRCKISLMYPISVNYVSNLG
jgi:hypothetical protein